MNLIHEYYAIVEFLNRGGIMLYLILSFAFMMWALIIERYVLLYFYTSNNNKRFIEAWNKNKKKGEVHFIRNTLKHQFSCKVKSTLPLIKMLITIIPLLGLLGTVWGMIEIFDVITIEGTGDAKAMASGISMATLPTMSGMAIAIVTLFAFRKLEDKTQRSIEEFQERLV